MTTGTVSLLALLERPVMVKDIRLGVPGDAVLDGDSLRVVGLEVLCSDSVRRFLPLAAARIRDDRVAVGSALLLLEQDVHGFYRRHSRRFRSLLGAPVAGGGHPLGELVDLAIASDGTVEAVATRINGAPPSLHARGEVTIEAARKATAA